MANRHLSRSIVLQALFEWDFGSKSHKEALDIFARDAKEFAPGMGDFSFMDTLMKGVLEKKKDILIYAMCCAGAFRHAARPIQEYARGMQELLRRTFNYHFERDPRNVRDLQSMQAWHLTLFVGGWSGSARASEFAQGYCGALDSMLRCGHYFDGQRGDWFEDEQKPVAPGEEAERWRYQQAYVTLKREHADTKEHERELKHQCFQLAEGIERCRNRYNRESAASKEQRLDGELLRLQNDLNDLAN